jgi:hypothetical protein
MTLLQSALILPVITLAATFDSHQVTAAASRFGERSMAVPKTRTVRPAPPQTDFVLQRKERIQNVLVQLEHIAQVTAQMKPETADRVEPVIVDLAEQAIDLANERALRSSETDVVLTRLEMTVSELGRTMNRYIEPEASL